MLFNNTEREIQISKEMIAYSNEYRLRNQGSMATELIPSTFYIAFILLLHYIVNSCIV